jgi:hypothetical protein
VVPFVLAGIGMYRASFESTVSAMPEFYRRRIASSHGGAGGSRTFQDVMLAIGGGAELFVTRHLGIRPEAILQIVTTRSDVHLVPAYTVQLAYHFDSHHIVRAPR